MNNRNKPCPCGSNKKYKKCCLTQPTLVPSMIPPPDSLVIDSGEDKASRVSAQFRGMHSMAMFAALAVGLSSNVPISNKR